MNAASQRWEGVPLLLIGVQASRVGQHHGQPPAHSIGHPAFHELLLRFLPRARSRHDTSRSGTTAHRRLLGRRLLLQHPQHRHRRFRHRWFRHRWSARRPASSRSSDRLNRSAGVAGNGSQGGRSERGDSAGSGTAQGSSPPGAPSRRAAARVAVVVSRHRQSRRRSTGRLGQAVSPGPHLRARQPRRGRTTHLGRTASRAPRPAPPFPVPRNALTTVPGQPSASFAELGVPAPLLPVLTKLGAVVPVPDPGSDPSGDARRPGRAGPRQDRLRQDHCLRHPAGHQAHRRTPGRRPAARLDPAAHP